jgi:hypothetical protein
MTSGHIAPPFIGFIETTYDARRLNDPEKPMIHSGAVFLFDEHESGIKRWTDGIVWSPSRILGNFLVSPILFNTDPMLTRRYIERSTIEPTIERPVEDVDPKADLPTNPTLQPEFSLPTRYSETCLWIHRTPAPSFLAILWGLAHYSTGTIPRFSV